MAQEELDLPHDFDELSKQDLKDLFISERKKAIILEKDLFKRIAEIRKLEAQYK